MSKIVVVICVSNVPIDSAVSKETSGMNMLQHVSVISANLKQVFSSRNLK
jgi:hypothetical protein